ncbi:ubiquitin domain-containing protein 2-like [Carassius carassius]|uniref:ubiquitin domain-containing protein 2-like n=1 Tax=Carassius carassius TaxID=217509 RepID=UPI0028697CE5|nr:ubiquitin domain-containing protein 2-like [Carassius carassius]
MLLFVSSPGALTECCDEMRNRYQLPVYCLAIRTSDNVQQMKHRLKTQKGILANIQHWFFSGRPLADKMKQEELKISRDYVVQVINSQPPKNPALPQNPTSVENLCLIGDINHHTKCVCERISMCMSCKIIQKKISLFLDWSLDSRVNLISNIYRL